MKRATCAALGLLAAIALTHCAAFTRPGCSDAMPDPGQLLVAFQAAPKRGGDGYRVLHLDRTGRSYFSPSYTRWWFTSPAECRVITPSDFAVAAEAWSAIAEPGDVVRQQPEGPYLLVFMPDKRTFLVRPAEAGKRPELDKAVAVTLNAFAQVYGERFVREIRALGLQDLRRAAPADGRSSAADGAASGPSPAVRLHRRSAAMRRVR